ncbi:hypothetical protein B0H16DRAFT_275428 [Mycena metata]|uniref:Uncharacterized protein n=1 Tax=Mycena metata TaxID=1033252 RepID=A0AAD7HQG5_9AGAR|nr:hypothetical protein B0H16DRAFT_275428 [Mycena metata]
MLNLYHLSQLALLHETVLGHLPDFSWYPTSDSLAAISGPYPIRSDAIFGSSRMIFLASKIVALKTKMIAGDRSRQLPNSSKIQGPVLLDKQPTVVPRGAFT